MNQLYDFLRGMIIHLRRIKGEDLSALPPPGVYSSKSSYLTAFMVVLMLSLFGGINSYSQTTYYSKSAATDFNSTASWGSGTDGTGAAPAAISNADNFIIANGAAMTLSGNAAVRKLTINAGSLTVASNTLTVSTASTFDSSFTVNTGGTFNISGGNVVVNGNMLFTSGGNFNQSGGVISVDGNNGGSATGSVPTGLPIFGIGTTATNYNSGTVTLTGGKIIIVDPHTASASSDYAFLVNLNASSQNITASLAHTVQIGDGVSTDAGGNATNGFWVYFWYGNGALKAGQYVINAPAGTNRHVFQQYRSIVGGDITVTKGELQYVNTSYYIGGNIFVDAGGTFTCSQPLNFSNATYTGGTSVSEVPVTSAQSVSGTGIFRNAATSPSANFSTVVINNSSAGGVTFGGTSNIASQPANSMSVSGTLEFKAGKIGTSGGAAFVLGNASPSAGTLTYVTGTGFKPGSTFGRWFTATGAGSTINPGTETPATDSRYPFLSSTGVNRSAWIQRVGAADAAGVIAFTYNEVAGTTPVVAADLSTPGVVSESRSNDTWAVSSLTGTPLAATSFKLLLSASGIFTLPPGLMTGRIIQGSAFVGTHIGGTATPTAQRSVNAAELIAAPFNVAIAQADVPSTTIASGNWNDPAIWSKNAVPTCLDYITITSGMTVTVNSAANIAKNVTINSGGTLTVASGDLTVGCTLNNNTLSNSGTLTVSGGTLNVNGNMLHASGSTFNQSGGDINVDGNSGSDVNSVASGTSIIQLNSNLINWTGGTLTIVDPHANSTASGAITYNNGSSVNVTAGHTLRFGNGVSVDAGGNSTNGFRINTFAGSGRLSFNNIVVAGGVGTNRYVTSSYAFGINGDLTINATGELRTDIITYVAGNVVNNGTFTNLSTLYFGKFLGGTASAATAAQTLSGLGTFANAATSPTAGAVSLTVNNTSATGVTLSVPLSLSGTLTLTAGIVNTSSTSLLTLGTATTAGTLSGGSATAYINGPFARTIASGNANTNFIQFPVGKAAYAPIWLAPATTSVAVMKAEAFDSNTGTAATGVTALTAARRWEAPLVSGTMSSINVRISNPTFNANNIPVMAPTANGAYASAWGIAVTSAVGPPATIQSTTAAPASAYTGFLSFAEPSLCDGTPAPGNTIASQNAICYGSTVTLSAQNTTGGSGVSYQWESSPDNVAYTDIASATSPTYTTTPTQQLYYRLRVTCSAGPSIGTSTALQITFANSITATTPATRCGEGTASLGAVASAGATVKWYTAATGGTPVATGTSYVTPVISANTTYYAAAVTAGAGNVIIGNGTGLTGDNEQPTAFNNRFSQYKQQTIYTAAELTAAGLTAGNITSIAYSVNTLGSAATNASFTVKIGTTTSESFASTSYLTPTFTTVFAPSTYTHTATGWQTITFTTPYPWDGVSNIVIEVSMLGANSSNNTQTYYTDTASNMVVTNLNDNAATSGTLSSKRLNITFGGQSSVGCASPRVPVIATVNTAPALTLSASAASICSGQSATITVTAGASDYDTYVWTPSAGVTGNAATGWSFSPAATTTYTLNATQSAGSMCAINKTVTVTVNALPNAITVAPAASTICEDAIQMLTASGATVSGNAIIGTGTTSPGATTMPQPFTAWYGGAKTQMIYKESELLAQGFIPGVTISSVAFDFQASVASTCNDLRIKIGPTANANMSAGFVPSTSLTTVYNATWTPTAGATGYVSFALTTPYVWLGGDIIVEVAHNQGNSGNGSGTRTKVTTTSFQSVYYGLKDGVTPAGMASYDAVTTFSTVGSTADRPNIKFAFALSNTVTWAPAANLYTNAAATTPYVAGSNAATVYAKSSAPATTTYTATVTNAATCTRTATADVTVVNCDIDWANVQWPASGTITTCGNFTMYAQVYKPGVTEAAGAGANITAWIGVSTTNDDPSTWAESTWHLATFNLQQGNNDEYMYTVSGLPAGTYYYASRFKFMTGSYYYGGFSGGEWNGTTNVNGALTVESVAAPTAAASQTFCHAGTVADLVASGTTGATFQWYAAATGGTALTGTEALTDGGVYYASQTVAACEGTARTMVTVTISNPAAPTAVATQSFCNAATVADLTATGTAGATIKWYADATGGTALANTTVLTNGGVYYASQTVTGCESATRTMVTATVGVIAAPVASASQTVCNSGTVAGLQATGTAGSTIAWYSAAIGGTALAGTTAVTNGGVYYASQIVGTCESATRTMVTVTINAPAAPTASATQTVCNSGTVANLTATGTAGATIQWYSAATGGTALSGTTALTNGGVYYASQTVTGCESATRTMVTVTISTPGAPTATAAQTFCNSGTVANLAATGTAGATISWYSAATGGTALSGTTALTNGGVYYASQTVTGCESASRTMVTVTINAPASPIATAAQTFCNSGTVANLAATGVAGATIQWYSAATGGTALTGTTALTNGAIYYASQTVTGCESVSRTAVTVTISAPAAPTATAAQTFCNSGTVANLVATGTAGATISWYSAATGGTALSGTTALTNGGVYYASQTVTGCESATRTMVTVTISAPAAPTATAAQTFCNSGTVANLAATGTAGATISWYSAATGGTALSGTTALTNGGVYYASQTVTGCESASRTMVTVTINAPAAPTAAAAQTFCNSGTVANLSATGTSIAWYSAATGGTALSGTTALTNGGVYYASQTVTGCESAARTMVTVTISTVDVPTMSIVQPTCASPTATLTVTAPVGAGYTYSIDGVNFSASPNFINLVDGTTYTVTVKNGSDCTATASAVINAAPEAPEAPLTSIVQPTCSVATGTITVTSPIGAGMTYSKDGTTFQSSGTFTDLEPGTYTITVQNADGCTSVSGSLVIDPAPAGPEAPGGETTQQINASVAADATIEDIVVIATGTVTWYPTEADALNGTGALPAGTQLVDGTTYYGTQTIGECVSATYIAVTVDVVLGREGFDHAAFSYYPNPVKDVLNISYTSEISSVTVFDLLGQQVLSIKPNTAEVKIDLSLLSDATYIVNVTVGDTVKTIKVVKKQ